MKYTLILLAFSLFLISCNDSTSSSDEQELVLNINGLEALGSSFQYEGWILIPGSESPISTGTFSVDENGALSQSSFSVNEEELSVATKFILTIEPVPDTDPAPSDQKYIAGDFSGNSAQISTATAPAIGDFSNSAGTLFLRTPTDETGTNNGNDENGVWFGTPGAPPTPNFTLPTLPDGWVYEGWVIGDGGPLSTGRFTDFGSRDDFTGYSGTEFNEGPPVPGEDFFLNAPAGESFPLDVRGRNVVISVEPEPDNSPAPFTLKPLAVLLSSTAETAPTAHAFNQNLGSFPTGSVVRN